MKIHSIDINNFKGIESQSAELKKVNAVIGPNGSGKTSFLAAVRACATGKMPPDALKTGKRSGSVSAVIDRLGTLSREWEPEKSKTLLNGKATTQKSVAEMMRQLFGVSSETVGIATSSEAMLGMSSKDFSKYLLQEGFMKIQTDIDQLVALCGLGPDAEAELRNYLPGMPDAIEPPDIDDAHKYYFALRAAKKKDHAEEAAKARHTGTVPARKAPEIEAEQAAVLEETGRLKSVSDAHQSMTKAYEANRKALADARAQIDAIKCRRPVDKRADELNSQLAECRKSLSDHAGTVRVLEGNIASFGKILADLSTSKCPISDSLVCTTDKTAAKGEISDSIDRSGKKLAELRALIAELTSKEADTVKLLEAERENSLLYQKKLQLTQQAQVLENAGVAKPEPIDVAKLPALQRRLEYLKEELSLAVSHAESLKHKAAADKAKMREEVYGELVDALGPKSGIRKIMLENSAAPLADHLNGMLAGLMPGRPVKIDTGDGFAVMVGDRTGKLIGFGSASASEQIRIALALFDMLNALSGFRVLLLDDLDSFDADTLGLIVEYAMSRETLDRYDTVIMAGVSNAELENAVGGISHQDFQVIRM